MSNSQRQRMLDLERLHTFEAVVRLGGFTAAAAALHKTQSTVSIQLKRLEEAAGERLMERNNQGIRLTPAGETLLVYSRRLLQLNAEALAELNTHQLGGAVRIGLPADYSPAFLSAVLPTFGRAFPRIEVQVHCDLSSKLHAMLAVGDLDLAIGTFDAEGAEGIPLRDEALVWAGLADGRAVNARPLPLALFPNTCQFRAAALHALQRTQIRYRVAYTSPALSGIETALQADFAVAAVARSSIRPPIVELDADLPALPTMRVTLLEASSLGEAAGLLSEAIRGAA